MKREKIVLRDQTWWISAQPSEAQSQKLMEIRDSHDTHRLKWRPKSPTKFEFEDSLINPESPAPPPTITTFPSLKGQLKSNPWNKDHAPLVDKSVSGVKQRFESQNLFKKPLPDVVRYGQCHDSIMSGLSFGHFSGNHRLVDLPEFWGFFWKFPLRKFLSFWTTFGKILATQVKNVQKFAPLRKFVH